MCFDFSIEKKSWHQKKILAKNIAVVSYLVKCSLLVPHQTD